MPEHIHLLLSEPEVGTPSTVMQVLKQRTAHALLPKTKGRDPCQIELFRETPALAPFWQRRFYDFNVWTNRKRVEKLRYMQWESGKTGTGGGAGRLALEQLSFLSSRRSWGGVRVNEGWAEGISFAGRTSVKGKFPWCDLSATHPCKEAQGWGTHFCDVSAEGWASPHPLL